MLLLKPRDKNVLELIHSGKDSKAISLLYDSSFGKIKKHIRSNGGNLQDAEDIFQDAITVLYRYIKNGKFDPNNDIDAFLFTISKNLWINTVKKNQRTEYSGDITDFKQGLSDANDVQLINKEREELIQNMFSIIGDRCKDILTLVIYGDHTMKDLVEKLGFSNEDSAKTQHYKCKQKLITLLGKNNAFKTILKDGI
jgi:RNA polymerase sigma factor (sigma-70 family)